jgi:integrase
VCQLLALTGQRECEIANLRRPWINEKEQTITLPEWVTKNSKEHTFPYGDMVAEILEGIATTDRSITTEQAAKVVTASIKTTAVESSDINAKQANDIVEAR